jgi:hypothetical protein
VTIVFDEREQGARGPDVDDVAGALGTTSTLIAAGGDLEAFGEAICRLRPEMVINLVPAAPDVAAALELLDLPYTGAGPAGLYLATDPAMARRLLASHGIPTLHGGGPQPAGHDVLVGLVGGELLPAMPVPGWASEEEAIRALLLASEEALRLRDYGLYAVRVGVGAAWLDGATPNPELGRAGALAACADRAGWPYEQLIGRIVDAAMERVHARVGEQPVI